MATPTLVVLEGDQTGQELLLEALRVLDASVIGLELRFERYDLSLERRRATANGIVLEAAEALKRHRLGIKAATVTPEAHGDVGSPNRILREAVDGKVIIRTGRECPACGRSRGFTRRSPWCAWRSATPTAPRSGAKAKAWPRSPIAPERIGRAVCR